MKERDVHHIVNEIVQELSNQAKPQKNRKGPIPIGVSSRHCHLNEEALNVLFGKGNSLSKKVDLLQPGHFAAQETVMIAGPKGSIENVRVLGPLRKDTQVEVSKTDAIKLGLKPPIRESGELADSSPITIIGPKGSIYLEEGLIIPEAHIHMSTSDAQEFGIKDSDIVQVKTNNSRRSITFDCVKVRVSPKYVLEMHIDTDEANAANVKSGAVGELIKVEDSL
ncbi:phosphate propanoyltransferase [Bacillus sp. FJAT-45350]|uniref:phosphate propanoyltransferase n=1 Tax=Bacillus sp. FJAT-45350 TaxID=2011014 RepID=UPI000BB6BF7D|nr:phosphate propanoyltransferase [Bacillus sp. FJAT-45350]